MENSTADIDAQIAALQALKAAKVAQAVEDQRRREKEAEKVLVNATPTKERPKPTPVPPVPVQPIFKSTTTFSSGSSSSIASSSRFPTTKPLITHSTSSASTSKPSSMSVLLAERRSRPASSSFPSLSAVQRSSSFTQRREENVANLPGKGNPNLVVDSGGMGDGDGRYRGLEIVRTGKEREGETLTILEDLTMGPKEFGLDPEGEEVWLNLEPNSGVRLSKRILPHSQIQDHLYGRYFLTPSQIYSVIRLSRDGATYDIPVDGDWVTIAVVAERGEVKVSGTKQAEGSGGNNGDEDDDSDSASEDDKYPSKRHAFGDSQPRRRNDKGKQQAGGKKRVPRKYINLKLCALGPRTSRNSVAGDTLLQLLLFEADAMVRDVPVENGDGVEKVVKEKSYRGGSGGAYEKWCNLSVGSVIAILNPRILRPLKAGSASPHPLTLPLALNPTSAESISLIGTAMDLGQCEAMMRDGNRCKTWVDSRVSNVCDYHMHAAIQRGRSGRAEFASASTPFTVMLGNPRSYNSCPNGGGGGGSGKGGYDHRRKMGFLPGTGAHSAPRGLDNGGGGATYVVGSGVVRTGNQDGGRNSVGGRESFGPEYVSEKIGRTRAMREKRRAEEKEAEEVLSRLLDRGAGSTGAKYLAKVNETSGGEGGRKDGKSPSGTAGVGVDGDRKRVFSASAIKAIGFDPSTRGRSTDEMAKASSLSALMKESLGRDRSEELNKPINWSKLNKMKVRMNDNGQGVVGRAGLGGQVIEGHAQGQRQLLGGEEFQLEKDEDNENMVDLD